MVLETVLSLLKLIFCTNFARLFYPIFNFLPYFHWCLLQDPSDNSVEYTDVVIIIVFVFLSVTGWRYQAWLF